VGPASLTRVLRALLLTLFAAVALVSCGGGEDTDDAEGLLDEAFAGDIRSADLKLDAELQLKGSSAFERPVRIAASGPFVTNEGKLPSADIELKIGTDGGQTVSTGVLLTGDRAFVKFQDVYYEQPRSEVRRANRALRRSKGKESSLDELGLDPRSWLAESTDEGEAEVAGVDTRHVSGTLDVESLLRDFNRFVRKSGSAVGGATGQPPPAPLSAAQIRTVSESVENPSFDVYVGKDDGIIRRVSGLIEFTLPAPSRAGLGGLESGSIEFSLEFADVNGDQEIEAPANARPLSELTRSLGGGALGALGQGGDGDAGTGGLPEIAPEATPPGNGSGGTGTNPEAEDFREYAECLDEARPEDTEALQRCAELLQAP
jgi:hypothetical protein